MTSLKPYRSKRHFGQTPEPEGNENTSDGGEHLWCRNILPCSCTTIFGWSLTGGLKPKEDRPISAGGLREDKKPRELKKEHQARIFSHPPFKEEPDRKGGKTQTHRRQKRGTR